MRKIGVSTFHKESMHPDTKYNFTLFFKYLNSANLAIETIYSRLQPIENLKEYHLIIIGAPETEFEDKELKSIREYVESGGNLLIILKYGGNKVLGTNIGNLFDDYVTANDDLLVSNTRNLWSRSHLPVVEFDGSHTPFGFEGCVCYDGGCTFTIHGQVDFAFKINTHHNAYQSQTKPRGAPPYRHENVVSPGALGAILRVGAGKVVYWGSRWSFSDEMFHKENNSTFFRKLIGTLLFQPMSDELEHAMKQPQRHRLLQAYPLPIMLKRSETAKYALQDCSIDEAKKIALGIIPHPFCNPSVPSCGFCTFPNEPYNIEKEKVSVDAVCCEIAALSQEYPKLIKRKIASIYFGGGTANLTSPTGFERICKTIKNHLDVDNSTEITLEGAPAYFVEKPELLEKMKEYFSGSSLRISIGIQTFDQDYTACGSYLRLYFY